LLKLLESRPGGQGAQIIYGLLEKLNQDLEKAEAAGNTDQIRTLSNNRAVLSGFLVNYAEKSDKPEVRKQVYVYRRFAASTKYEAALLEPDQAKRKEQLQQALAEFKKLTEPASVALYKQSINPKSDVDPNYPDPQVTLRIGLIAYDLGDYQEAQNRLSKLLNDRKLGTAVIEETDTNGISKTTDNEQYWEAVLKLLKSNVALGVDKKQLADYLQRQYNRWGDRVGGQKWKKDFAALRADLGVDSTSSQPTTAE
jgi:tetratricopeptide (TPR) repeat protein